MDLLTIVLIATWPIIGFVIFIFCAYFLFTGDVQTMLSKTPSGFYNDKVFWITGASSGIGKSLAEEAVRLGARVIISSRREGVLKNIKAQELDPLTNGHPEKVQVLALDLCDFDSIPEKGAQAWKMFGHVDYLVNNAGKSTRALCVASDFNGVDIPITNLNYLGQVAVTKSILGAMVARQSGHFINISSAAGKTGFFKRTAYCGSKWGLLGFFESLRSETAYYGLKVCNVCPGYIQTPIAKAALNADGSANGKEDPNIAHGMPAKKCSEMILAATACNVEECWVGTDWLLMVMYLYQYVPYVGRKYLQWRFRSTVDKKELDKYLNVES